MKFLVTPRFARNIKGLHPAEKNALDEQLRALVDQPEAGDMKKGDLAGVRVVKYKHNTQQWLLAHEVGEAAIILLAHGSDKNFYRNSKR
ncbi:type II toxin-antitoxin system RelE/ParE family toxin [Polaromonas sp.]|uniref:type II toxin-antitoxin system RelE/ParE family toxin n=1 Tax=Polaromonas sp. TaxID=1869339 RepID=UPI0013BD2B01|nr:type II toxin-antitoxin system RelE/ParE family toxin [Polaromonas sp.]NDP61886.1 type II toxin-antitoxin system RelE/ParE family toxin [Polaromonas sp.]